MRPSRLVLTAFGTALLAGCVSSSPSPSPEVDPSAGVASAQPAACVADVLLTPNGNRLDLTGRWRGVGSGGTYYIRQSGSCVWFAGLSTDTGAPGGENVSDWTNAFFGTLSSDFTVRGSWADLPWGDDDGLGELGWQIEFAEAGEEEVVTLGLTDATGGFGDDFLVRPDRPAQFRARLQEGSDCLELVTETGETYPFINLPAGWTDAQPTTLFGPEGEVIHVGDTFDVIGDVADSDACGRDLLIFPDSFEVGESG